MMTTTKRWVLVNKNTGKIRISKDTRDAARTSKRSNERIFDNDNGVFVR